MKELHNKGLKYIKNLFVPYLAKGLPHNWFPQSVIKYHVQRFWNDFQIIQDEVVFQGECPIRRPSDSNVSSE